jgi:IS1 family transposase
MILSVCPDVNYYRTFYLTEISNSSIMVSMNRLDSETRAQVIRCLVDGNSIRATVRITGIAKNTVTKLLVQAGAVCAEYQDRTLRNLSCRRIQCDEIWAFVGKKDKNVPEEKKDQFGIGSVWTWTAIDADTKLVPCWMVGPRDGGAATEFIQDLAGRLRHRVQLTTDGHKPYLDAVEDSFGSDIDYAMLVKIYGADANEEKRYSPAVCMGTRTVAIMGDPDPKHISTSYVERANLTMRMSMRRFTRLTNGFSKKIENHVAALSLYFMYYNFVRIHQTLRVTPAMAAGVTSKLWSVYDIVNLIKASEPKAAKNSN